jgi:hypothetical protein
MRLKSSEKRFSFTLLEVVICIALISMFASVFAWKGNNLLQHYLLRSSAKTIVREINTAHLLALSYQTDVSLKLVQKKGEIFLEWQTEEPLILRRCTSHKMRGVKNILIDYKLATSAMIASFSSASASSCKRIDLQGGGEEGCRIELQEGRPVVIQTIPREENG